MVLQCELSPSRQLSPAQWDTHPPCPLSALQPLCYPLALLSRLCSAGALQCTGDRLLETNSPTQGSRLLTACPVESKLCPRAILLYFPPRRHINLQTLIHPVRFLFRATIQTSLQPSRELASRSHLVLLTPSSRANSHPTNTRSLLAGCNLLSACPALQTLQGGLLWGAPRACLRLPA